MPLSQMAAAVRKPDGVVKVSQWLKTKGKIFKLEGQTVKLA